MSYLLTKQLKKDGYIMKTKKITAAILAVTMLAGMTACSDASNETTADTAVQSVSETASETVSEADTAAETTAAEADSETAAATAAETEAPVEDTSAQNDDETKTNGEYHTYGDEVEFDLNSDGENEIITYTLSNDGDFDYADLSVNGMLHQMYFPAESYLICDIDPTDKYYEIAFSSTGMSDDYSTDFLRYDNGELYWLGNVGDTVDGSAESDFNLVDSFGKSLKINGDGTITAAKRLSLFQTWYADATYKLNNDANTIEEIQGMYYPYGEALKDDYSAVSSKIYDSNENWPASHTSQTVNLYSQPDTSSDTVVFEAQNFAATATDDKNWIYLVGESGVSGWLYYENNNTYDEYGQIMEFGNNAFIDAATGERFIDGFNEEGTYYTDIFCGLLMYD